MKHWFEKNYKTLIIAAFLIPIITVAIVSISHVTAWYGISNPVTWSVYLSIGIEIAALSALAAISANMGKKVYFPFAIVTLIQFIGNIFFAYTFIDISSKAFKDWVDLVAPLLELTGVEPTDFVGHKRFLALFAGGMLPIISLSFLHMLVKFTEEDRIKEVENDIDKKIMDNVPVADIVDEVTRLKLSQNDLDILEKHLLNPNPPNEALIKAAKDYVEKTKEPEALSDEEILKRAESIQMKKVFERAKKIEEIREAKFGPMDPDDEPTALANSGIKERILREQYERELELEMEDEVNEDDEDFNTELNNAITASTQDAKDILNDVPEQEEEIIYPLSNNDINSLIMGELERNLNTEEISTTEPENVNTEEISTIDPEMENIFQDNQFDGVISEPFVTPEEVERFNLDEMMPIEVFENKPEEAPIVNDSFWRDHLHEEEESEEDDLKKKS